MAGKPNKDLTPETKLSIAAFLLEQSVNLKVSRSLIRDAANCFKCSESSAYRVWKQTITHRNSSSGLPCFNSRRVGKCGRKKQLTDIPERLKALPWRKRRTMRSIAKAIQVSPASVHRSHAAGEIVRHTNSIKPRLTEANMTLRLEYCLSFVNAESYAFSDLANRIFIDEKWFYMTEAGRTIYMSPDDIPPHRTVQSKRFITKVMFMAAVMRPIYASDGSLIFDGKLGIWPFTASVPAKNSSKNRPAGTLVTQHVNVDRKEQRAMLIDNVIPAIKSKCPSILRNAELIIQQDGARCHVSEDDPAIRAACRRDGWNIRIELQPANSPDLNILDLGYFCSIQALQYEESPRNIDELIKCTITSYQNLRHETLEDTFVSLQKVMECIIEDRGNNSYKRPHIGKAKLRKAGLLGNNYVCDASIYMVGAAYHFLVTQQAAEREALLRLQLEAVRFLLNEE